MARDHHERIDGKGYPQGLSGDDIDFSARVCAVVDVYDAITAARPYRGPIAPVDALNMMREGRGTQFDSSVFDAWEKLVQRLIHDDPERAIAKSAPGAVRPLRDVATSAAGPTVIAAEVRPLDATVGERRRHERLQFRGRMTATFLRQGKALPIPIGQPFLVDSEDISRSGVGLRTPWPLSLGDLLCMQFPIKGGKGEPVSRYIKVVRVRRTGGNVWLAGCCFVELDDVVR